MSLQVQIRQKYAWPIGFCTTPRPRKDSWAVPCMERYTDFTARLMKLVLSGQLKKLSTSPQSRWRAGLCQKCPPFSQTSSSAWTINTCVSRATRVSKILSVLGMNLDLLFLSILDFSNWVHGDIRQYDISDPKKPKLTGQLFLVKNWCFVKSWFSYFECFFYL